MNHFHAATDILRVHLLSQRRTGKASIRIYNAWINRFTTHFIRYQCCNCSGVYSLSTGTTPFYVGKTSQRVKSRVKGHVRLFLKSLVSYITTGSIYMNAYHFVRWCNLLADNRKITVRILSADIDDERECIVATSVKHRLTNMEELISSYHDDTELVLSDKVRERVAMARYSS